MGDDALRVGHQRHFRGINGQVTHAQLFADHQLADVHAEFPGDFPGQAFDFHFARHHFENAALQLDALRLAESVHGHLHLHAHVHGDFQQVHVNQRTLDGIHLPVFQNGGVLLGAELHFENRVVSGFRPEDARKLLGIDGDGDRRAFPAVQDTGNLPGGAETPRSVFAAVFAGRGFDNDLFHTSFLAAARRGAR